MGVKKRKKKYLIERCFVFIFMCILMSSTALFRLHGALNHDYTSIAVTQQQKVEFIAPEKQPIDIALVYGCLPARLKLFLKHCHVSENWDVRFLMVHYDCDDADIFPSNIHHHPVVVTRSSKKFTRSSNINILHGIARASSIFIVLDVDIIISDQSIRNALKYVKPGVVYFPIVWSRFNQATVHMAEQALAAKFLRISEHTGIWRYFGYGIFCIRTEDFSAVKMDERFVTWGGEDNDFHRRVLENTKLRVVREKDASFVHMWHAKDCSSLIGSKKYIQCMGSKAALSGSKLLLKLENDRLKSFSKSVAHPKKAYRSPNEILSKAVFVIKTYERSSCLMDLLESLYEFAPTIPIIIADDSRSSSVFLKKFNIIKYLRLPNDSGVGMGRNILIREANNLGYEYVIMSDDDYILTNIELLPKLAQKMIAMDADVVAPKRCEINHLEKCERGEIGLFLVFQRRGISILPNTTLEKQVHDCMQSDLIQQFFLGKTSVLLDAWDDHLKSNDHYDAMLTLKKRHAKMYQCNSQHIVHNKLRCTSKSTVNYKKKRFSQWLRLMPYVLHKHKLAWFTDEVGRNWSVSSNKTIKTQCGEYCLDFPSTKPVDHDMKREIEMRLNSIRPAYDQIKLSSSYGNNGIAYVPLNTCQSRVEMKNTVFQWRNRRNSKPFTLSTNMYLQHWCSEMLQLATYDRLKVRIVKNIYYVIPLSHLDIVQQGVLQSNIQHQQKGYDYEIKILYVVLGQESNMKLSHSEHVIRFVGPFSHAIALKIGYEWISKHVSDYDNVVVVSMDAGMQIPPRFSDEVITNVICGKSVFAPISQDIQDKRWIETGFGINAMCLKDYFSLKVGWNHRLGYHWGAEDLDITYQIQDAGLDIVRYRTNGFMHRSIHNAAHVDKHFYKHKNFLGKYLPTVPQTWNVSHKNMRRDMVRFVEERLRHTLKNYSMSMKIFDTTQVVTIKEIDGESICIHSVILPIPVISKYEQDKWRLSSKKK